jgi:hypothetical protein
VAGVQIMKVTSETEIDDDYYLNIMSDATHNLIFKNGAAFTMDGYSKLIIKICDIYNDRCFIETKKRGYGLSDVNLVVTFGGRQNTYCLVLI